MYTSGENKPDRTSSQYPPRSSMAKGAKKKQVIRSPKRGAIPTPRYLLAGATPYTPESAQNTDDHAPQEQQIAAEERRRVKSVTTTRRRLAMARKPKRKSLPRSPM